MAKIERKIIVYFEVDDENPEWEYRGYDGAEDGLDDLEDHIISQIRNMPGGRIIDMEVK